jgi:2-oxo-4-hydroxy-4-carboxy-5-ureidoimidazoline decarboxylase
MDALSRLNELDDAAARAELARCCGATAWAAGMAARRPFADRAALLAAADEVWAALGPDDWREAFAHHPRIGDLSALRARFAATRAWAAGEQAGVQSAGEDVLAALAEGNRAYEERFGYIFIVCATGLRADEMLARLQARLPSDPAAELRTAAAEQAKITRLRLEKLLDA